MCVCIDAEMHVNSTSAIATKLISISRNSLHERSSANEAKEKYISETNGSLVACVTFFINFNNEKNVQTFNWCDLVWLLEREHCEKIVQCIDISVAATATAADVNFNDDAGWEIWLKCSNFHPMQLVQFEKGFSPSENRPMSNNKNKYEMTWHERTNTRRHTQREKVKQIMASISTLSMEKHVHRKIKLI